MAHRKGRAKSRTRDAGGWQRRIEELLMTKRTKATKPIDMDEFERTTQPKGLGPYQTRRFYEPIPSNVKRRLAEDFSKYLEESRSGAKQSKSKKKVTRAKTVRRSASR